MDAAAAGIIDTAIGATAGLLGNCLYVAFAPTINFCHIRRYIDICLHIDPEELKKSYPAHIPLCGVRKYALTYKI